MVNKNIAYERRARNSGCSITLNVFSDNDEECMDNDDDMSAEPSEEDAFAKDFYNESI